MPDVVPLHVTTPWLEIRPLAADWDAAGPAASAQMLQHLHLIRAFEETGIELLNEGLVHGPWHSCIGQEGGAVGAMSLLRPGDQIAGAHRGHHQFLAKALRYVSPEHQEPGDQDLSPAQLTKLRRTLSEILGLSEGYCRGRGGSMHLRWAEAGILGTNAIVGGGVPFANGVAWAKKMQGTDNVVLCFFGDGAINIGTVSESMNLAGLYRLPICFFIENNFYAIATSVAEANGEVRLSSRGGAFGIPAFRVDGMDPLAVRLATQRAVDIMRAGGGPTIIEAEVYRFYHHTGPLRGSAFGYRSKEEEETWQRRDPLLQMKREMARCGWLTEDDDRAMRAQAKEAMRHTLEALLEPDGNNRRIRSACWPDPGTRDFGLRSEGHELQGLRYEELEGFGGTVEQTKFINVVAGVMARQMESDPSIVVFGEDIHRLKGGRAKTVRRGAAFTVLTYLSMVHLAVKVADELGLDAEVVDLRSLDRAGLDWETIGASIRKTHNVVIAEQGPLAASYGAMLADEIQNRFFDELDQPVKRIHGGYSSPSVSAALEYSALVGATGMRAGFLRMLADQGRPLPRGMPPPPRLAAWAG